MAQNALTAAHTAIVAAGGGGGDVYIRVDDWQDKTDFEREQDITQGEVGDRLQGVTDLGEDVEVPEVHVTQTNVGKEDRKRRKQERRRAEKAGIEARKKEVSINRKQNEEL